jgi:hypothetical protein
VYCWEEGIWGFCIFGMNGDNGGSVGVVDVMEERESLRPDRKSSRENGRERVSDEGERK